MEPDAGAPVLGVEDLRVSFASANRPLHAVDGVELTVGLGETVALVGESGCGKTMTGLAILGLTPPEAEVAGRITFEGQDVRSLPPRQLRHLRGSGISMVFQEPVSSLNPVFRIGEQIRDVIRAHDRTVSRSEARDRAVELLERLSRQVRRHNTRDGRGRAGGRHAAGAARGHTGEGPSDCRNHARRGDDHTSSSADNLGWRRRALAIPVGPPRRAACAAADRSCRVQRAREAGFTWAQIAAALGVSPQPPTRKHVRRLGSQGNRPT